MEIESSQGQSIKDQDNQVNITDENKKQSQTNQIEGEESKITEGIKQTEVQMSNAENKEEEINQEKTEQDGQIITDHKKYQLQKKSDIGNENSQQDQSSAKNQNQTEVIIGDAQSVQTNMTDEQIQQAEPKGQNNQYMQEEQKINQQDQNDVQQKKQSEMEESQNNTEMTSQKNEEQINRRREQEEEELKQKEIDQEQEKEIENLVKSKYRSKQDFIKYVNVLFYAGKFKSNFGRSQTIHQIQERYKDYRLLEMDHAYIQWIFPNKYKSSFNSQSKPLSDEEIEIFLVQPLLAKRVVKSYEMMLDFYGMSIKNYLTGELKRNDNYKERYYEAVCGHNCLRIRRILTSLSNLGFRNYAIELNKFLFKEITQGALIKNQSDYSLDWEMYKESQSQVDVNTLEQNCFQSINEINRQSVFFTSGLAQEKQEKYEANNNTNSDEQNNKQYKTQKSY